jgi:hypothetical protein
MGQTLRLSIFAMISLLAQVLPGIVVIRAKKAAASVSMARTLQRDCKNCVPRGSNSVE